MTARPENNVLKRLTITVVLLLVFIIASRSPADADMWWHLRAGEEMRQQGSILLEDIFSYTRYGTPWVNAFWLADIGMASLFRLGGYFALGALVSLMAVAVLGVVYTQMDGPVFLRAALLILAALTISPIWTPRPQLFSFLLLALLDRWFHLFKQKKAGRVWWLIPLFALWANLHGGYIWGMLLLVAVLVGELLNHWLAPPGAENAALPFSKLKKLFLFSALAAFAVLLNPNGAALWRLPFHTVDVSLAVIQEWLSPNFHLISFQPLLWMLFLFIAAIGLSGKRLDYSDLLKVVGFSYMTFVSQRNIAPFAIIIAPVTSRHLAAVWEDWKGSPLGTRVRRLGANSGNQPLPSTVTRLVNALLVTLIAVAALGQLYVVTRPAKVEAGYPADAVRWIDEHQPPGPMFNSYNWGGYLLWTLPDYPVFIDGRADLYGDELIGQWWRVARGGEDAWDVLDRWNVRLILLEPDWPVVRELSGRGWRILYQDETAVVYGR
ncbi:MAG: hypothetical protein GXP40_13005 [Chloroflexi bacterium]|nr:hypothetical protein [Chloroflexota bacterium]